MNIRRVLRSAVVTMTMAALAPQAMPSHAATGGTFYATGAITSTNGCSSGSVVIEGTQSAAGSGWDVDATAICSSGATPQNVFAATSTWTPDSTSQTRLDGGITGALWIFGRIPCKSGTTLGVQMQMAGGILINATATFSRNCP